MKKSFLLMTALFLGITTHPQSAEKDEIWFRDTVRGILELHDEDLRTAIKQKYELMDFLDDFVLTRLNRGMRIEEINEKLDSLDDYSTGVLGQKYEVHSVPDSPFLIGAFQISPVLYPANLSAIHFFKNSDSQYKLVFRSESAFGTDVIIGKGARVEFIENRGSKIHFATVGGGGTGTEPRWWFGYWRFDKYSNEVEELFSIREKPKLHYSYQGPWKLLAVEWCAELSDIYIHDCVKWSLFSWSINSGKSLWPDDLKELNENRPENYPPVISETIPVAKINLRAGVDGVTNPERIYEILPEYPESARAKNLEGEVVLEALVLPDGRVLRAWVDKSPDSELSEAARKAVEQWWFKPAEKDGQPVPVIYDVVVKFCLDGSC